jgi:membrane fusion protein (multidrug efflux system)
MSRLPHRALAALAVVWLLAGCERPTAQPGARQLSRPIPVTVVAAERSPLRAQHTVIGTLTANKQIHIYNEIEGRIVAMPFHEGDPVEAGAVLVRLEDVLTRAELTKAIAQRRQTELDLSRQQKLFQRNATSEDEVARARTALALAQAEEDLQRVMLSRTVIDAPFAGLISERLQEPGDAVPTHTHLMSLMDPTRLNVELHVSELLLQGLRPGEPVTLHIDALGERAFEGRITRIHPVIEEQTRQGVVEVALAPTPPGARPGQLVRATLTTDRGRGLVVPFAALRYDVQGAYVYRIGADDAASHAPVAPGLQIGDQVQIREGLSEGDRVIVRGLVNIRDGKKVRIVSRTRRDSPRVGATALPPS